jgi:mRNA interferase MazF
MARATYVPDRGDCVKVSLDPQLGHEQAGYRPALVLTPQAYNRKSGLCVICPATTKAKGYDVEVANPGAEDPATVILIDQIRCIDWRTRRPRFVQRVAPEVLEEVVAKLDALIINPNV